jgi:hypothetical protein
MASFREIAEQNIFPGESGGDYNALFGYSNREGGRYGGTRLTDMTVNQALDFSQPSGDYGQWVKGQVGRVATPMGAYQVVGTTLRAAQQGLGLTGNERMDEGLQDRIGEWIYQNQGPGAWEGWRGNTQARASTNNAQPPSTRNAPTGGILSNEGNQMAQPQQPQRPQGLLGSLGVQRRDPNAQGETSQPFYNRQSFGDTLARMAPALGRMGVMGLEGPMQAQLDTRNQRQGDERAQAMLDTQRNQTREWIASQPNGEQFAAMFDAVGGEATLKAMQAANAPAPTSASFEGLRQQALAGGLVEGTPEFQNYILNGGGDPENIRGLRIQAIEAGLEPGTPEFENFMLTRGAGDQAYAATVGQNVGQAETIGEATAAEDIASASVQFGVAAYDSFSKLQTSLGNIDEAISAIDGGAQSGLVYNMLPSVTEASASLENAMNRMGLDVIGSVTFGALSEGEMRLAMSTAVPQNLAPAELRAWLVRRRDAQAKAAATMQNAAEFLTTPGPNRTINDWIARNKAANEGGATSAPPAGGGAGDVDPALLEFMSPEERALFQ